jgi:uncharacterized protein (DUF2252 family)
VAATQPTFEDRWIEGRVARYAAPRSSHGEWSPAANRPDPVALIEEQAQSRIAELVPLRHARMMVSPFTFYRGAALIMAADLAETPNSGIEVQLCGDAHLSNFGVFGSPERNLIFDINDFDETLPGPWEWDVKRLAASFEVAGRSNSYSAADRRSITRAAVRGYREQMKKAATSDVLTAWYDYLDADRLTELVQTASKKDPDGSQQRATAAQIIAKAQTRDSTRALAKLVGTVDGERRILADPPLIVPIEDLEPSGVSRNRRVKWMRQLIDAYQETLPGDRHPIEEFRYVHMARKVVGVGSVGTQAWIVLFSGRNEDDALMLQAKEAQASVLERFLKPSQYSNHGERVVRGQRIMQAASDIFLGWQTVTGINGEQRDFYFRQLADWKGSVDVEGTRPEGAKTYALLCGQTLARAHARSGDRVAIAAYLGDSDRFDRAIANFARDYADQNERDYESFVAAVRSGRLEASDL